MITIRIKVFNFDRKAEMQTLFEHKLSIAESISFDFEGTIKCLRSLFPTSVGVEFNIM